MTKIILRLLPLPKTQTDLLVPFDSFQAAADTVSDIIAHRILPTTMEFMERDSMQAVERLLEKEVPFSDAAAQLLVQLDGNIPEAVEADMEVVGISVWNMELEMCWSLRTGRRGNGSGRHGA